MSNAVGAWLRAFVLGPGVVHISPYYAAILGRMQAVYSPATRIMAVSESARHAGEFYLHVNVEFFVAEPQYLLDVLLHEVHHVVLGHLSHPKFHAAAHPDLMEIAQEISAYARPSRRFPALIGQIPGRSWGLSDSGKPHLLVAIDTSASVSAAELAEIASELEILRDLARITVAECDARIQRVYPFQGCLDRVLGRGGTDLRPVYERAFLDHHRPDGVVYFTDGIGPYPQQDPGVKTLWVLTKERTFDCAWGAQTLLIPAADFPYRSSPRSGDHHFHERASMKEIPVCHRVASEGEVVPMDQIAVHPVGLEDPEKYPLRSFNEVLYIFRASAILNGLVDPTWIWEWFGGVGPPMPAHLPLKWDHLYIRTVDQVEGLPNFRSLQGSGGIARRLEQFPPASQGVLVNAARPIPYYDPCRPGLEVTVLDRSGEERLEWIKITRRKLPLWKKLFGIPGRLPPLTPSPSL